MKSKEEILDKFLNGYPWQHWAKDNALKAMEEYRNQPSDNTQSINKELVGEIWDASTLHLSDRSHPDKKTFINSLNLDNTQIRDGEDDEDEPEFQRCSDCDGHDACEDFGCAIKAGIIEPPL